MIKINIKRLIRKQVIEAAEVLEEDEEPKSFKPKQKDEYVNDIDGYYFILFLEKEFGKSDLGGIFSKPNGSKYNRGYMKSVKDGKKGVTVDLYHSVQEFIPNFEASFREFVEFVNTGINQTPEEIQKEKALQNQDQKKQKYIDLANSSVQATSNFCKFLVSYTGLNPAQIQDAIDADPNQTVVGENGKNKIPKETAQKAIDVFDFTIADFKAYLKTPGAYNGFSNAAIEKIKKQYEIAQ